MPHRTTIPRARDQVQSTYQPDRQQEEPATRQSAAFVCPRGHEFTLVFADDVELPSSWECRQHSTQAELETQARLQPQPVKVRTHLDMLRERRSEPELAQLLDDQLKALRAGQLVSVEEWVGQGR